MQYKNIKPGTAGLYICFNYWCHAKVLTSKVIVHNRLLFNTKVGEHVDNGL